MISHHNHLSSLSQHFSEGQIFGMHITASCTLLYAKTTDYHWPRFEQEMSDMTGKYDSKGEGLSDGPFGFGKSVKLKAGVEGEEDDVCLQGRKQETADQKLLLFAGLIRSQDIDSKGKLEANDHARMNASQSNQKRWGYNFDAQQLQRRYPTHC